MDRNGNKVRFDDGEQECFHVEAEVSVDSALQTAESFNAAAEKLVGHADTLVGDTDKEAQNKRDHLLHRAGELKTFSAAIRVACSEGNPVDRFIETLGD